ncbi:MAG: UDP-2,3-diacetamido-2,3-dideoxy-D-glucuronate 2-epimerase [Tenericutes bacterium ADurb.Bin239]|jgi:UDP-N-acetylglucosamine 2-epimerase (non-hydrolysing)|nr:MAG: UDP-2,3-diacetamido-2,3-dideoxy-D-glucuronate 2-epimerase [Tenericutes bacterium ADurb.Bin239]
MSKLKLMTILGTRPEIIRLSAVIKKADEVFNHILVNTGQNYDYELNEIFFNDLGIRKPDYFLEVADIDLGETMGNIIAKSFKVIAKEKPDAVLILGDTNSALAAISAKRLKVPIFHMEAGNRCWDWNVSEMINRRIVDSIADINLPYTENSRLYLIEEGIDPKTIFVTGSPMAEVIHMYAENIEKSKILSELKLERGKYILVSCHREENIDLEHNFYNLMTAINDIAEKYQLPVIYSVHPRSKKWIEKRNFIFHPLVKQMKPLGFFDYNKLQKESFCVLSDSGTLSEESAMLNFPGILIRTSTERPEALDFGSIIIGGITTKNIIQSINLALALKNEKITFNKDYQTLNVSTKVVKIIQSYAQIINIKTWRK